MSMMWMNEGIQNGGICELVNDNICYVNVDVQQYHRNTE